KLLPAEYIHNLSKKDLTIAEAMKEEGYKTFYAGKWHLGGKGSYPEDHGFDINKGGWESGSPQGGYFSPWINPKLENNLEGENLSMRLANETVKFITEHKDTNFFAVLSFYAVHGPIETTNEKWKKYKNKVEATDLAETGFEMERVLPIRTKQDNPIYAGLVESVDDAVGKVLNSLEELGLNDKTIVIFTSDNGGVASGDAYSTSNLPLRGGKGYQWEGGIRVPYFIKIPWLNVAGAHISYPVSGTDFFPTILELTNSSLRPTEHLDGISLKALIEGKSLPDRQLVWHYPHYGNQGGEPNSTIIEGDWKLIHYWEDDRDELYNLNNDLNERTDLSKTNIDDTQRLKIKLEKYLKNVNAVYPKIDLKYDEEMASQRHEKIVNELRPKLEEERIKILQDDFKPNNNWWGSKLTKD
ncbi:MAG: sulfatase, partial [Ignavibacteriae bacterium]|nr:sulfatase [Ignavibacteriota bacterium]